jgi:RimJ/RimL family protein N-acetyltransferase
MAIMPVIGQKVILFEVEPRDFKDFAEIHRKDKHGYLQQFSLKKMTEEEALAYTAMAFMSQQIIGFTAMTKEGKAARRAGYVYIGNMTSTGCMISGVMDVDFVKGLGKLLRKDKYTYSEDAVRTLVKFVFEKLPNIQRIETNVLMKNKLGVKLVERAGFQKEGVMRKYLQIDDILEDVGMFSIVREDFYGAKQEAADNLDSRVPEAVTSGL